MLFFIIIFLLLRITLFWLSIYVFVLSFLVLIIVLKSILLISFEFSFSEILLFSFSTEFESNFYGHFDQENLEWYHFLSYLSF